MFALNESGAPLFAESGRLPVLVGSVQERLDIVQNEKIDNFRGLVSNIGHIAALEVGFGVVKTADFAVKLGHQVRSLIS